MTLNALKAGSAEDLIDALDSASRGDFPISPAVAGYLFKRLRRRERAAVREMFPRRLPTLEQLTRDLV